MANSALPRALPAAVGVLVLFVAPGAAADIDRAVGPTYAATIGADAVMPVAKIPHALTAHLAGGAVSLSQEAGSSTRCRAFAAGYWLGEAVEDTLGDLGPAWPDRVTTSAGMPAAPGMNPAGQYQNPTVSYRSNPDPGPTRTWGGDSIPSTRDPGVRALLQRDLEVKAPLPTEPLGGSAPDWTATCPRPTSGRAVARSTQAAGMALAQSTAAATVDRRTGAYRADARTIATEVRTPTGTLGTVGSLLAVRVRPGGPPLVSYRISVAEAGADRTAFSDRAFVVAGTDVPATDLVTRFNAAVAAAAPAVRGVLGPAGLQLLAPIVERTERGRIRIVAPALAGHLGLAARDGSIGTDQGVRLGTTYFEGDYGAATWSTR